jgi:hypothetical protein
MAELGEKLSAELEELKRVRDELRVRIHLGAAEAREVWEKTERKLGELEAKVRLVRREAREPLHEVGAAARLLLQEIRDGYRRIRDAL